MRFKIGEPINSRVGAKIQNLQNTFGAKEGASRLNYVELQSATPWIRMQSGVELDSKVAREYNIAPGDALAKKYVLFGLNTRVEERNSQGELESYYNPDISSVRLPGYTSSPDFGYRPKPGITGMQIQSHNRFGSLRTATVNFQCWTKEDIDAIELLYMRPGYTVMLEWGHSKNLSVDGREVLPVDLGIDFFETKGNADAIYQNIIRKRLSNAYGYDAILGQIKNFSWKFRPDGGYDCSVDLISPGELIESFKANFFLPQDTIQIDLDKEWTKFVQNGGSKNGLFPSTVVEDSGVEYNLSVLPSLSTAYSNFIAQAELALGDLKGTISTKVNELKVNTTTAEPFVKELLTASSIGDSTTLYTEAVKAPGGFLEALSALVQTIQIAKGGLSVGEHRIQREFKINYTLRTTSVSGTGGSSVTTTTPISETITDISKIVNLKISSKWSEGIADLNIGKNITDTGLDINLPEGGFVAAIPVNAGQALKTLQSYNENKGFDWRELLQKFINTVTGEESVWQALSRKSKQYAPTTAVKEVKSTSEDTASSAPLQVVGKDHNFGVFNTYVNQFVPIQEAPTQAGKTEQDILEEFLKKEELEKFTSTSYKKRGSPATTTYRDLKVTETNPGTERTPFLFIPLKFTGYDANKQVGGTTLIQSSNAQLDEEVPRDQYLSKLHYYLRQYVEKDYAASFLVAPAAADTFKDRFKYRVNPNVAGIRTFLGNTPSNYNSPSSVDNSTGRLLGGIFVNTTEMSFRDNVYIKFKLLLELINRHILRSDADYFFTFVTDYTDNAPEYFTFIDHISMDPRYCILPHTVKQNNLAIDGYAGDGSPTILDIELSINFVLDTLAKYLGNDGKASLLEYLQDILDNISRVCGGVNDFQLQYIEDSYQTVTDPTTRKEEIKVFRSKFHVVDRRVIAPISRNTFISSGAQLNLFGIDSIIQDVNLVSKLTPKITSMIAISAQASPYTTGEEATGFNAINKGLTDRVFGTRYEIEAKAAKDAFEEGDTLTTIAERLRENISGVLQNLGFFYQLGAVPVNADEQVSVYENYVKFMIGASSEYDDNGRQDTRLTYNFIIPFELNLTLFGISGIKVMDAFVTSQDILPKTYGGRPGAPIAFLVTGVEHTVDKNGWKTNLKTQIYNIDESNQTVQPGKDKLFTEGLRKKVEGVVLNFSSGLGSNSGGTGGGNSQDPGPGKSGASLPKGLNLTASWEEIAKTYLVIRESFTREATKDVNAYRLGYGTDSILIDSTKPASKENIRTVKIGDTTTQADAIKVLVYEIPTRFKPRVVGNGSKKITEAQWNSLSNPAKAALIVYAYNVGGLTTYKDTTYNIAQSIKDGNLQAAAIAIQNGPVTGDGVYYPGLRIRRDQEAKLFLS